MAFRVKDLMIQVVPGGGDGEACSCTIATKVEPAEAGCGGTLCSCTMETKIVAAAEPCGGATLQECSCTIATAAVTPPPGALTTITTVTTVTTVTAIAGGGRVPGLRELMDQLRRVLEESERQGAPGGGLPQTVEESEDLERRLSEAIKELQDQRKSLHKAKAPAKKGRKGKK